MNHIIHMCNAFWLLSVMPCCLLLMTVFAKLRTKTFSKIGRRNKN